MKLPPDPENPFITGHNEAYAKLDASEDCPAAPCSGLGWRCGMTSDPLCEIRYDIAELMEYLGHASLYVRRARDRFEDADEPDDTIAVLAAQSKARAAGLAFREVERMARVMAEIVEDWAAYTREEKCPDCNGTGLNHVGGRASKEIGECVTCHGRKFLSQNASSDARR